MSARPTAVLLLPRTQEDFILRDQAEDLLRAERVVAVEPGRVPYGAYARLGDAAAARAAKVHARLLGVAARPDVVVIFHPLQLPVAEALEPGELWYARWDSYEEALDASPAQRERLKALHERARERSALTFAANEALGGDVVVGLAADSFPAPAPGDTVIAVSLGHVGRRVDWALLHAVTDAMPELVLLLVGDVHPEEMQGDADFAACQAAPGILFLGRQDDESAARLFLCADVGLVPFARNAFNETGLPYRILKAARLGRRTVSPRLAGPRQWEQAVIWADTPEEWVAALRAERGRRTDPDLALRAWALGETAEKVNAPLWDRLRELGIA